MRSVPLWIPVAGAVLLAVFVLAWPAQRESSSPASPAAAADHAHDMTAAEDTHPMPPSDVQAKRGSAGAIEGGAPGAPISEPSRAPGAAALPPLPLVSFTPPRPMEMVRVAYEFAGRHPEVLQYIPCYCGCEHAGHRGNEDCFVAFRHPDGRPVWDAHGIGCGVCIDVAFESSRMHAAGAAVRDIRAVMDEKYGTRFPSRTPTPMP